MQKEKKCGETNETRLSSLGFLQPATASERERESKATTLASDSEKTRVLHLFAFESSLGLFGRIPGSQELLLCGRDGDRMNCGGLLGKTPPKKGGQPCNPSHYGMVRLHTPHSSLLLCEWVAWPGMIASGCGTVFFPLITPGYGWPVVKWTGF
ncbi:hypothetical protein E2542_SST16036 [Spatholobus suberectus]|nr:hypothetical protein E2542_SST16036 [Spatholobus suberectus]